MDLRAMLKALRFANMCYPQLKDNGALANNTYIDTQGLSALLVLIQLGATDIELGSTDTSTEPYLEECDTPGGTYTKITGAELSGIPDGDDDGKIYGIFVDLTKTHKRYIRVNAPTAGDGTAGVAASIIGVGFPSDQLPHNAAGMGLAELVEA